jgi:hypothetical protein
LFAAGFISVLVFQMGALAILNALGFTPATPFSTARTSPLGVPQIWSLALWGGVWGLVYGFFEKWFPGKFDSYWVLAILFGAILPTAVLWFVVSQGSDQDGNAPHNPRRMGIGHCTASGYRP